jgi:flagellar hook-associated protein 3 FlgL
MQRVSSDQMNDDMQFWTRRRERDMASAETKMARQTRIENLRDDPLAAARAVRYDSVGVRLERYEKNAAWAEDQYKVSEGYVRQTIDITQRLREIAVQGANGTFTKEDQKYMAQEVDQLLGEMVNMANARGPDGSFIFSGDKARTQPFREISGTAPGSAGDVLVAVQYLGAQGGAAAEISEGDYMPLGQSGADVFWAEKQQAVSGFDARDWRAAADSTIVVDGKGIGIKAGDNVYAVAAKINDSGAAVKASIDPRSFSLALETTTAHQLRLEDIPAVAGAPTSGSVGGASSGGGVFKELGLLSGLGKAPDNWAPSARVSGGSLFDAAIRLRDSLNRGDALETGGASLAGIDSGLDNLNRRVAEIGARSQRLQVASARLNREIPDTAKLSSEETDLDLTKAITDYKMLEYAHTASLSFSGRLFSRTLLDFLR